MNIQINNLQAFSQFDFRIANFVTGSTFNRLEITAQKNKKNYFEDEKFIELKKFDNLKRTIEGFSCLETNWDSYEADAISEKAIDLAIRIIEDLRNNQILITEINIHVFPMRDGGIQFDFDGHNLFAELEINPDKEFTFLQFNEKGKILSKKYPFEISLLSSLLTELEYESSELSN